MYRKQRDHHFIVQKKNSVKKIKKLSGYNFFKLMEKKKILFVCIENSNRSQMAEAFAAIHGNKKVEAFSAGSRPSGIINPKAIASMKEIGYDLSGQYSKSLDEIKDKAPFDAVITMGCGDACPWMPAKQFIDWQIPDPKEMKPDE